VNADAVEADEATTAAKAIAENLIVYNFSICSTPPISSTQVFLLHTVLLMDKLEEAQFIEFRVEMMEKSKKRHKNLSSTMLVRVCRGVTPLNVVSCLHKINPCHPHH